MQQRPSRRQQLPSAKVCKKLSTGGRAEILQSKNVEFHSTHSENNKINDNSSQKLEAINYLKFLPPYTSYANKLQAILQQRGKKRANNASQGDNLHAVLGQNCLNSQQNRDNLHNENNKAVKGFNNFHGKTTFFCPDQNMQHSFIKNQSYLKDNECPKAYIDTLFSSFQGKSRVNSLLPENTVNKGLAESFQNSDSVTNKDIASYSLQCTTHGDEMVNSFQNSDNVTKKDIASYSLQCTAHSDEMATKNSQIQHFDSAATKGIASYSLQCTLQDGEMETINGQSKSLGENSNAEMHGEFQCTNACVDCSTASCNDSKLFLEQKRQGHEREISLSNPLLAKECTHQRGISDISQQVNKQHAVQCESLSNFCCQHGKNSTMSHNKVHERNGIALQPLSHNFELAVNQHIVDDSLNQQSESKEISREDSFSHSLGAFAAQEAACQVTKDFLKNPTSKLNKALRLKDKGKRTRQKFTITPPIGAPYVNARICIKNTELAGFAPLLIDSGAERSLLDVSVAVALFGQSYKSYLKSANKPIKMFSATNHKMPHKGFLELEITMGNSTHTHHVGVNEFAKGIFLLGNDFLLDKVNYNHGRYLTFEHEIHDPIPINYHLPVHDGHLTESLVISPNSSVLTNIFVSQLSTLKGREVYLTSMDQSDEVIDNSCLVDTMSVVNDSGHALALLTNVTDDQIFVSKSDLIAKVHFISPSNDENDGLFVQETDQAVVNHIFRTTTEERAHLLDGTANVLPEPDGLSRLEEIDSNSWYEQIPHSHLTDVQWNKLKLLVIEMGDAFIKSTNEMGLCKYFEAELPLKEGTPYLYSPPRPIAHHYREEADQIMQDYLNLGIIRKSNSPFATNIVCVKRKAVNGVIKLRAATDLRLINNASIPCRFPNTSLDDALAKIGNARYRSSLDFRNAFFQISIAENSRQYTSFFCNGIQYEYTRLPMGHVSAMGIFCMMMALLCENFPNGVFFADDVMCITIDKQNSDEIVYDKHIEHLREMFRRIVHAGLKLNPAKCYFANHSSQKMEWLGFTLENCLLLPQQSKVERVLNFPTPTTAKQALSFVSLASFYRRFIKSFAKISKPIYEAIKIEPFQWTQECDHAAEELKQVLTKYPVLRIPQLDQPFQIWTDASASALGAVLTQVDLTDGRMHPCAYASRKFNATEMNLSTPCKELIAVIYALNLWHIYILGQKCTLFTDCRAWTFLRLAAAKSGKISRLALIVQEFDIDIKYVPANKNLAADSLSRQFDTGEVKFDDIVGIRDPKLEKLGAPSLSPSECVSISKYMQRCDDYLETNDWSRVVSTASQQGNYVDCIIQSANLLHRDNAHVHMVSNAVRVAANNDTQADQMVASFPLRIALVALKDSCFSKQGFAAMQRKDFKLRAIRKKLRSLDSDKLPAKLKTYFLQDDLVYKKVRDEHGVTINVLCIPEMLVDYLLNYYHSSLLSGHIGPAKLYAHLRRMYYWPNMDDSIRKFHDNCLNCQFNTKYPVKMSSGTMLVPRYPNHIVHVDILSGMPRARNGATVLFLLYDGFSKFCFALPLRNAHADKIVADFMQYYVPVLGPPHCMHSDRGQNVDGLLMHRIARMLGMRKARTPTYNPNSNPCEVLCGLIGDLLRKWVSLDDQKHWPHFLAYILYALNFTTNTATGFTPASLMLGRLDPQPLVPLIPAHHEVVTENDFLESIRRFQEYAFQLTRARHEKLRDKRKELHNVNAHSHNFKPGDFVLVRDLQPASKGNLKLRPKYRGPYRVVKAFESSLQVIPWDESERLDELQEAPQFVQRMNEVRPFLTDTVPVKLCKPCKFSVKLPPKFDTNLMDKIIELLADYECPDFESVYDDDPDDFARLEAASQPSAVSSSSWSNGPRGRGRNDDDDDDDDGNGDLPVQQVEGQVPQHPPTPTPPPSSSPPSSPDDSMHSATTDPMPRSRTGSPPSVHPSASTRSRSAHSDPRSAHDGQISPATPSDASSSTPSSPPRASPPPPRERNTPQPYNLRPRTPQSARSYDDRPIKPAMHNLNDLIEEDLLLHAPRAAPQVLAHLADPGEVTVGDSAPHRTPRDVHHHADEEQPAIAEEDPFGSDFALPEQDPAIAAATPRDPASTDSSTPSVDLQMSAATRPIPPMVDPDLLRSTLASPEMEWDSPQLVRPTPARQHRLVQPTPARQPIADPFRDPLALEDLESSDLGILPDPVGLETPPPIHQELTRRWLRSQRPRPEIARHDDGRVARQIFPGGRHPSSAIFDGTSPSSGIGVAVLPHDSPQDRTYEVMPEASTSAQGTEHSEPAQAEPSGPQHGAVPRQSRQSRYRPAVVERPHTRAQDANLGPVASVTDQLQQQEEQRRLAREQRKAERQERLERLSRPKSSRQQSKPGSSKSTKSKSIFKRK